MEQVEQAIEGYRQVLERDAVERASARRARAPRSTTPKYELTIADLLEPLYRHVGDLQKLIGVHEVQVRRSDDVTRRVELLHQIAQLYEDAAGDLDAAFATLARALKEDPANETTQQQLDRVARATGRFADLAHVFETLAAATSSDDPRRSPARSTMMSARVHENDLGNVDTAIALYRKVLEIDPLNLAAAESLERLFRRPERYAELSIILQRKAEILEEPAGEEGRALPGRADRGRRPRARRSGDRRLQQGPRDRPGRPPRARRAHQALPRPLALAGPARGLREEGRSRRRRRREEAHLLPGRRGLRARARRRAARDRHVHEDPRARSRTTSRRSRGSTSSTSRRRTGRSSSGAHARERDDRDPNEAISFQYRIAELYEKHLDDVHARGRALSRDPRSGSPITSRRCARSRA